MKFYYYLIGIVFLFFVNSIHMNAQNKDYYGFSKTYFYSGDSLKRGDNSFYTLDFIPNSTNIIFALNSRNIKNTVQNEWFKIDINGNKIAQSIDSIPDAFNYSQKKIAFLNNNSKFFYVAGWYPNKSDGRYYLTLQKIDTSLNSKWKRIYNLGADDIIYRNTTIGIDNEHLLMCFIKAEKDATRPNGIKNALIGLWKMDTLGNIVWKKTIDSLEWNNAIDITHAHDGNLMICGITEGYGGTTFGRGLAMKIDTAGNKIWHKVYNLPDYNGLEKIIATGDGHYICAGWARTPSTVIYMSHKMPNAAGRLLKIDENGNIIWDKIIDISDREDEFRTLIQTNNGDIIAIGVTGKYHANDSYNYQVGSTREPDGWAVRLDKDGNIKWSRVFGHNAEPHAHDYLYNAIALPDGGFIASGSTMIKDSTWWNNGEPIYAMRQSGWVVKLDSMGCLGPGCPEMLADYIDSMKNPKPPIEHITEITLYPNPGGNRAILENKAGFSEEAYYYISDISGKVIQDKTYIGKQTQVSINFKGSANAQYIIKLQHNFRMYSFKYAKVKD